jgi:large subunit ribosomal protein L10
MALTKAKKTEVLAKAKDIAKAKSVIFANFKGLTSAQTTELRRAMRAEQVGYTVAKKTLVRKAFDEAGITGTMPETPGELCLAFSDDLVAPARNVYEFQKKFDKKITIVGGVFDGVFKNAAEMMEIAAIPPLQTLRGMFVNIINSPIQGLVLALNAVAEKKGGTNA